MLKQLTLLVAATFICATTFAQQKKAQTKESTKAPKKISQAKGRCPIVFPTTSAGLNNNAGVVGVGLDILAAPRFSVDMGAGFSTWGKKVFAGAKYYTRECHSGWAFGGGATYATGQNKYTADLQTVYGTTEPVELNLHPQVNAFIAAYKYWNIGKRFNRVYLELGWSLRVTRTEFDQTAGSEINTTSVKAMNVLSPGGLIIGFGFAFGIPRGK